MEEVCLLLQEASCLVCVLEPIAIPLNNNNNNNPVFSFTSSLLPITSPLLAGPNVHS